MQKWHLLLAILTSGCAFVREIPAVSTPVRTERYYRTQDAVNLAGGVACNVLVGLAVRDTTPLASVARVAACATAGLAQRQLDKGYRESSAMFITIGSMSFEFMRVIRRLWKKAAK